jgi:hypothetical protein
MRSALTIGISLTLAGTGPACKSAGAACSADRAEWIAMSDDRNKPRGEVLRLRHRYMIEHIRRAENPAWTEALERQQTVARLGRMFQGEPISYGDLVDHALRLKHGERD